MEAIKESMSQMSHLFNQRLAEFEDRQQKLSAPPSPSQDSLNTDFDTFKTFSLHALRTLQSQVELLARQTDNLEMHSRRKILLLHGVPEDKSEDTLAVVVKVVSQSLKVSGFQAKDIKRCHRMGSSSSVDRPRPILFKVRDLPVRAKIWLQKSNLKGSGVTVSEFLTKARHDTFMAARQRFGLAKCWTRDGFVFVVTADGVKHRVTCLAELNKIDAASGAAAAQPEAGAAIIKVPSMNERSKRTVKPKMYK